MNAINKRDYQLAHSYCVKIVKKQRDHADAYFLLGIVNSELGQFHKAIKLIETAVSFDPLVEYFAYLAKCYLLVGNMSAALSAAQHPSVANVDQPLTLGTLGIALSRILLWVRLAGAMFACR